MIVRAFVTGDAHFANGRLTSLLDADLNIDGVVHYALFDRNDLREQIPVI
ncbi:MAG: Uncharacterised protein [Cryomorphaceae bacterium]|nr:MAG: Uncharacterised protein [Cryomorphaceae bacterium]